MDYSTAFQISAAGMTLEKARVDVTALNIANMNTSRAPGSHSGFQGRPRGVRFHCIEDSCRSARCFESFQARVREAKPDELLVRDDQYGSVRKQVGDVCRFAFACDQSRSGMEGEAAHSGAD